MKRQTDGTIPPRKRGKRSSGAGAASSSSSPNDGGDIKTAFRSNLFSEEVLSEYQKEYKSSTPYHHAVIHELISDPLLLSVKREIIENLHFTPKETDIYRIHQSGDLANISGLPKHLAKKLPSLRRLRDALYSQDFRDYICSVTGCGALSGKKTDMAINVYTPGCHLLTHDDVIGSRRVSYILYLCGSPEDENPWDPSWGGALRLYPTVLAPDGTTKVPEADWCKSIPPSWNQLSFFEVVPGESFHDVEEVYDGPEERIRMAISGWFHIPQAGEPGYIAGLEEELGKKSSLQSLQSKADAFDRPQQTPTSYITGNGKAVAESDDFTAEELGFLAKYITPILLTPDTVSALSSQFVADSSIQISDFLRPDFADSLKAHITTLTSAPSTWSVAVPPHKQKYLYLTLESAPPQSPLTDLLTNLFPSIAFKKFLQYATRLHLLTHTILARRFRRGTDYTLATPLPAASSLHLEISLGLTPPPSVTTPRVPRRHGNFNDAERTMGGYEMYMAADDDDDGDAAVYKAQEDDAALFMNEAAWNQLSVVLRDEGVLRFVKYVSAAADADRWDVVGEFEVEMGESDGEGGGESDDDGDDDDDDDGEEEE